MVLWYGFWCWFLVVWVSWVVFFSFLLNNGWFSKGVRVVGLLGLMVGGRLGLGLGCCGFGCILGWGFRTGFGLGTWGWDNLGVLFTIPSGLKLP